MAYESINDVIVTVRATDLKAGDEVMFSDTHSLVDGDRVWDVSRSSGVYEGGRRFVRVHLDMKVFLDEYGGYDWHQCAVLVPADARVTVLRDDD